MQLVAAKQGVGSERDRGQDGGQQHAAQPGVLRRSDAGTVPFAQAMTELLVQSRQNSGMRLQRIIGDQNEMLPSPVPLGAQHFGNDESFDERRESREVLTAGETGD